MSRGAVQRALVRLAGSAAARPLRAVADRALAGRRAVVRVRSGNARGARLELDLARERAYWLGHYEPEIQAFLAAHVRPGQVVYDVGAHVGFHAVGAACLGAEVHAFEPVAASASRLRRNAELNALPLHVHEAAAWDDDGGVAAMGGYEGREARFEPGGSVRSVSLDAFADRHPDPHLVKLDVEGAELRVLTGARRLVERARPVVLFELHDPRTLDAIHATLGGYRLEDVGPHQLAAFPPD